jgi:hypothetical protein
MMLAGFATCFDLARGHHQAICYRTIDQVMFHVFLLDQLFYNEWPDDDLLLGRNM